VHRSPTSPGFFGGAAAFVRGLAFVVGTPRAWPRAAVPILMALVLVASLAAAGVWAAFTVAHRWVDNEAAAGLLGGLLSAVAIVAAYVIGIALAQPLSGWALDGLVRAQESALGVPHVDASGGFFTALFRSLRASLAALAIGLPILATLAIVQWLAPPAAAIVVPCQMIIGGLLVAWELLDYPFALRGMGVRDRARWVVSHFGATLGFGLVAVLFLGVPGLGLVALPFGVAGATRLAGQTGAGPKVP
jgi:CysZ protein